MIKVKASLVFKGKEKLPTDVVLDIPKDDCNRAKWNDYIKEALFLLLSDRVKVDFEVLDNDISR